MQFFAVTVLIVALIGAVIANIAPTPAAHCDFKCTKLDLPTCSTNGKCFKQFTGICALEKYNCRNKNPQKAFRQVDQFKCEEASAPRCQNGDF